MSLQGLMQKGAPKCSRLEKVADVLLKFPRVIWLGKNITVELAKGQITSESSKSFANALNTCKRGPFKGLLFIFFAIGSVFASIPLFLGLSGKKIALYRNKKAEEYHQVVELQLKKDELITARSDLKQKKQDVEKQLENMKLKFGELEIEYDRYSNKPSRACVRINNYDRTFRFVSYESLKSHVEKKLKELRAEKQNIEKKKNGIENELAKIEKQLPSFDHRIEEIYKRYGTQSVTNANHSA